MSITTIADTEIPRPPFLTVPPFLRPPKRVPDANSELQAVCRISEIVADDPRTALGYILELAIGLCGAGSAGLSLLRSNTSHQPSIRWEAVSGKLAARAGTETPRDFSPCGLCIDTGTPVLLSRPEQVFTYLSEMQPGVTEELIVPLYNAAKRPLGTIWLAHHDPNARFCADDARIADFLATQAVLALTLLEQVAEHRSTLALLESHRIAQRNIGYALSEERDRRDRAEISESRLRQAIAFKNLAMQEVHHRVKNTLQIAATLLSLEARATPSAHARIALTEGHRRLHVLSKVHELLYRTAESAQEVLMPTLFEAMADGLRQSFAEMSDRVTLKVSCEPVTLTPDEAIPLALLANEIITNAYKHAFPSEASGGIVLRLKRLPGDAINLQITDDGLGLRRNREVSGLGLELIRRFALQLQGTLTFSEPRNTSGTIAALTFSRRAVQ